MSESDDSDDWATEDLPVPTKVSKAALPIDSNSAHTDEDEGWQAKIPDASPIAGSTALPMVDAVKTSESTGSSLIIVDMTMLSEEAIHSRFDACSVNDPAAVKQLRVKIESEYALYAKSAPYLADGTVIPCGSSVWRPALARLRQERPGHYFCPIFPASK